MSKQQITEFATVGDFITFTRDTPPLDPARNWSRDDSHATRNFSTVKTFQDAVDLASKGWPEGLDKLTKKLDLCLGKGRSRYRMNDVAGDYPDIGRFLGGVPDSMSRRVINEGLKRPIIDIILNVSFAGNINPKSIINYGAALTSVMDELENAGFRVGVKICMVAENDKQTGFLITIKTPSEALELDRMVYFMAHPSFLRALGVSFLERTVPGIGHGYGYPKDLEGEDDSLYFGKPSNLNSDCSSLERARDYVKGIIRTARPDLFNDAIEAA